MILFFFLESARAICMASGCISDANCTTCKFTATHTVWQAFDVSFTCDVGSTSCTPNLASANSSVGTVQLACENPQNLCCLPGDPSSVCDSKTCLVNGGCLTLGECDAPNPNNFRPSLTQCCNFDSDCPQSVTSCDLHTCVARSCIATKKFDSCCATSFDCLINSTIACLAASCVPDDTHPGLSTCVTGIDANCVCSSNNDCNDQSVCTTNVCGLNLRCTSTFFASSGGATCCENDAGAPVSCATGDVCRNVLGCNDSPTTVMGLTLLPSFTCNVVDERPNGCCTQFSDCQNLVSSTSSPCLLPSCDFSTSLCDIKSSYVHISTTLPCCHDSFDCEPLGQTGSRCVFLSCNNPEVKTVNALEYYTCTPTTIASCSSSDVVVTNAATTLPALAGNCTWTCGQPGTNVVNVLARLTNPSSGPNTKVPLYTYYLFVRVNNNVPALTGIIHSITMIPKKYIPSTRSLNPGLFAIEDESTEVFGTYNQKFTLTSLMPIYPDETLEVEISITFNINATTLASTDIALDVLPYDICTVPLTTNPLSGGTNGTPCAIQLLPPAGDLGNILLRPRVPGPSLTIAFPAQCPTLCDSLVTSASTTSAATGPSTPASTSSPTPAPPATTLPTVAGHASGQAFFDLTGDGINRVPVDPIAKNIRFILHDALNISNTMSTNTDANGVYTFTSLPVNPFYISVLASTIPYGHQPSVVPSGLIPHNWFQAATLRTANFFPGDIHLGNVDLGLVLIPPCDRAIPPTTPTGRISLAFQSSATSCISCASLMMLRSKCTPNRCANLMTRQFVDVFATVSNSAPVPLGADSVVLRLNSIGVGSATTDVRPYSCAEVFAIDNVGAYPLDTGSSVVTNANSLASVGFGWKTLPVGTDVVRVHAQFTICAHDIVTHFNVTAELSNSACIDTIVQWNRCNQTIDIRPCQATLARRFPPCAGCPPTPAPPTTHPHATTLPESELILSAQPYCFSPLCVNSQTFVDLRCPNVTAVEAQCATAVNRGEVLYQAVVVNPTNAPPSESGRLVFHYQRHAVAHEQLVCGSRFEGNGVMPILVLIHPSSNSTVLVEEVDDPHTQTIDFTVPFPSLAPGAEFIVSMIAFECSAHPLNVTFTAALDTLRCRDNRFCAKIAPPMTSLSSCVHYRATGCTETVVGVVSRGFGISLGDGDSSRDSSAMWPYIIAAFLFFFILLVTIIVLARVRNRTDTAFFKQRIALRNTEASAERNNDFQVANGVRARRFQ